MRVEFTNRNLQELYSTGKNKKYTNVPADIIKKFLKAVAVLESIDSIQELWAFPSYKFEKLDGTKNQYSMRMNNKWRLELSIIWVDETKCEIEIVNLENLTAHYHKR